MDSRVLNAYARMGFTVTVDPNAAYAGHFDARSRSITIQEADETIYHELGHFLAFIAGNVDQSSAFASVYNSEKAKFTGYNKAYATQNAAEYFAESVKDYMLNGAALSSQRPNTYKAIQSALNTVTTARADVILKQKVCSRKRYKVLQSAQELDGRSKPAGGVYVAGKCKERLQGGLYCI